MPTQTKSIFNSYFGQLSDTFTTNLSRKHAAYNSILFEGVISDSNDTFLWQKSEDTIKKEIFPKFHLIHILHLQVMQDYVHWPFSISLEDETRKIAVISQWHDFCLILLRKLRFWRTKKKGEGKKQNIHILIFFLFCEYTYDCIWWDWEG